MSDWTFLNQHRTQAGPPGAWWNQHTIGFNGAFMFAVRGEARAVCCLASDGHGWQHVSVSFGRNSSKTPSWEIMCWVKRLFWEPEDIVMQLHPAESQYVNQHPGCLHLWRPLEEKIPLPPAVMV